MERILSSVSEKLCSPDISPLSALPPNQLIKPKTFSDDETPNSGGSTPTKAMPGIPPPAPPKALKPKLLNLSVNETIKEEVQENDQITSLSKPYVLRPKSLNLDKETTAKEKASKTSDSPPEQSPTSIPPPFKGFKPKLVHSFYKNVIAEENQGGNEDKQENPNEDAKEGDILIAEEIIQADPNQYESLQSSSKKTPTTPSPTSLFHGNFEEDDIDTKDEDKLGPLGAELSKTARSEKASTHAEMVDKTNESAQEQETIETTEPFANPESAVVENS